MKQPRVNPYASCPEAMQELISLQEYTQMTGLDVFLIELVRTRVSQVNGCAQGIRRHTRRARELGESEERLCALDSWRETSIYSERERAALAWAEAVTLVCDAHILDRMLVELHRRFEESDVVKLTLLVAATNAWNRMDASLGQHLPLAEDSVIPHRSLHASASCQACATRVGIRREVFPHSAILG